MMTNNIVASQRPRVEFIILFGLLTSLTALSISAVMPVLSEIKQELMIADIRSTQLIISLFLFGMVFGEIIFGPLSDTYGRKPIIAAGIIIFLVGSLVAYFSSNLTWLIVGRIIQGIGIGGPKIGTRALMRDLYSGDQLASITSFILMILIIMPMLAPILGQNIAIFYHWRGIFLFFAIFSILLLLWLYLRQEETLKAENKQALNIGSIYQNILIIIKIPQVMAASIIAGMVFGAHISFVNSSEALFKDIYNIGDEFVYYYLYLAAGSGIASFLNGMFVSRFGMVRLTNYALLLIAIIGCWILFRSQFISNRIPYFEFLAYFFGMFFCVGIIYGNINAIAMQYLGKIAGIGASFIASFSSLISVFVSLFIGYFYNQSLIPFAIGFVVIGIIALWLLNKNKTLEKDSKSPPNPVLSKSRNI